MAQDAHPNFRVNVYGNDPQRLEDMERGMAMPGGGTGGLPWFSRPNPAYRNPAPVDPYKPTVGQESPTTTTEDGGGAGFLDPTTLLSLILGGGSVIGGLFGNRPTQGVNSQTTDPAIQAMLQAQMARMNKSEPLYDAIIQMAGGLMPVQYQPKWPAAPPTNPGQTRIGGDNTPPGSDEDEEIGKRG